jgi:hypothetical protein
MKIMARYRKLPVEIEAFQVTIENIEDQEKWPDWFVEAIDKHPSMKGAFYLSKTGNPYEVNTLEGKHQVSWNDYLIQGVKGELYPCKPEIFELTYEKMVD